MSQNINLYRSVYFIACFLSLFFIDVDKPVIEMITKILALVFLSFLYLEVSIKINYFYLLILMNSITSDVLLIFDDSFLKIGTLLILANRFLYIIIARRGFFKIKTKTLLIYLIPALFLFGAIFIMFKPYLQEISLSFLLLGITSVTMIGLAFFNYLNDMSKENKLFLLGLLLILTADVLMVFNKFLDYKLTFVIFYTTIYYIARYLICLSMIDKKTNYLL